MNVSDCLTPADLEPEPDSSDPIRVARCMAGGPYSEPVHIVNSLNCSKIARKGYAHEPAAWLTALGYGYPTSADLPRNLVIAAQ